MMQPGDLVFHIEDAKDYENPPPGLITEVYNIGDQVEAIVYFSDREFGEYHLIENLIYVDNWLDYKDPVPMF